MSLIDIFTGAVHAACLRDLPDIEELIINHAEERTYLNTLSHDQRRDYYDERKNLQSVNASGETCAAFFAARGISLINRSKRPHPDGCNVKLFSQIWHNGSGGYDERPGVSTQGFIERYTIIIKCRSTGCAAVYFGGNRLAYLVSQENQSKGFAEAIAIERMPSQREAKALGWLASSENQESPASEHEALSFD